MSNSLVSHNDVTQALSKSLVEIAMGRDVKKSKLQKQIDISDAINRRMQTQVNTLKAMIEAKKQGIDFSASMREVRLLLRDADTDVGEFSSKVSEDE